MTEHVPYYPPSGGDASQRSPIYLELRPERRYLRTRGSRRYVDFAVRVTAPETAGVTDRAPLALALVLDRSGSMAGDKLHAAKRAALAVLSGLGARDRLAVVIFDDHIDVLQALAPVTDALQTRVRAALDHVEARASTALHEGWLTGCQALVGDGAAPGAVARCFLLTDGLANVGITDAEAIASDAAGIRARSGVSTSTFGIGRDYDEGLLGPLAVAGGGQFHHLRTSREIGQTFVGELGGLLGVVASHVRLEWETAPAVGWDLVSAYRLDPRASGAARGSVDVGDLVAGEERHVLLRFAFPPATGGATQAVRARLVWRADGAERHGGWQELSFAYADDATCDAEPRDPSVLEWAGVHEAERAKRDAAERGRAGDVAGARVRLAEAAQAMRASAPLAPALVQEADELDAMAAAADALTDAASAKEAYARAQRRSRGQQDRRGPAE